MKRQISSDLVGFLRGRYQLDWRGIHGAGHWIRVRANGLRLAPLTGADSTVVELFAVLHDVCREDEGFDLEHGARSAELVLEVCDDLLSVGCEQAQLLAFACRWHSHGGTEADVTVQTCWDADRLDLGRVGIQPDPRYLCTPAARRAEVIEWAHARSLALQWAARGRAPWRSSRQGGTGASGDGEA
jgi:uncharacterized protein